MPIEEPALDTSLNHYLEARALELALSRARDAAQRAVLERLAERRAELMRERAAFTLEATARRHARGEIYSAARVAALNALGPSRDQLEQTVKDCYLGCEDAAGVLRAHARIHYGFNLVAQRLNLVNNPPDILAAARALQAREDEFAAQWLRAIDDPTFSAELRKAQQDALRSLRTATRPIFFVSRPVTVELTDDEARALGKAWSALDALAPAPSEPLSAFLAVPGEDDAAAVPAPRVLKTVSALLEASKAAKLPGKRVVLAVLEKLRAGLSMREDARVFFDLDL